MIYLDHNASTPLASEVCLKLQEILQTPLGNPSSLHQLGQNSATLLYQARCQVAQAIEASPSEILFTSSGTESNLSVLRGALHHSSKKHLILSAGEHPSLLKGASQLEKEGYSVSLLPLTPEGGLDLKTFRESLQENTGLVSVMLANNETGVLFPLPEILQECQRLKILVHTDAVQALGKIPLSIRKLPVDFLSASSHKIYGPSGSGFLYVRKGLILEPLIPGYQENKRRGGTENILGMIGLGVACTLLPQQIAQQETLKILRDSLEEKLLSSPLPLQIHGRSQPRIGNTSYFSIPGLESAELLLRLDRQKIYCSSGSACSSGKVQYSHVLNAMKRPEKELRGSLRLSLGKETQKQEIEQTAEILIQEALQLLKRRSRPQNKPLLLPRKQK